MMVVDGFITKEEAADAEYTGSPYIANYEFAREKREHLLRLAYSRLEEESKQAISDFIDEKKLLPHCLFRALKKVNGNKKFWEWEKGKSYREALLYVGELGDEIRYHGFI
jgi:4-alpha-glucanotransferase